MELCTKFSLQDLVNNRSKMAAKQLGAPVGFQGISEVEVRYFMTQILSALEYLHGPENKVIHRDLSLKNIFLGMNHDRTMQVKIGDFGMSIKLEERQEESLRNSFCGTYHFISPEMYKNQENNEQFKYTFKNDIWALGVIFFTLLTGSNPFTPYAQNLDQLKKLIKSATYKMPSSKVSRAQAPGYKMSNEARDLVFQLLQENPAARPSVQEIMQHPFFTFKPVVPESLPEDVLTRQLQQQELIRINEQYIKNTRQHIEALTEFNFNSNHMVRLPENLPSKEEIDYFAQQVQTQKAVLERI